MKIKIVLPDPPRFDTKRIENFRSHSIDVVVYKEPVVDSLQFQSRTLEANIVILDSLSRFDPSYLSKAKKLKHVIGPCSVLDRLDLDYCKSRGISVHRIANYNSRSVAEIVFASSALLLHSIPTFINSPIGSNLKRSANWLSQEMCGKRLGVVGAGNIGKELIRLGKAMGMEAMVYTRHPHEGRARELGIDRFYTFYELLKESDIVALAIALNDETLNIINEPTLHRIKPSALLVNASNLGLIDVKALARSLYKREIAGAALCLAENDTLLHENDREVQEMLNRPNVITIPRIAFDSSESLERLSQEVYILLESILN